LRFDTLNIALSYRIRSIASGLFLLLIFLVNKNTTSPTTIQNMPLSYAVHNPSFAMLTTRATNDGRTHLGSPQSALVTQTLLGNHKPPPFPLPQLSFFTPASHFTCALVVIPYFILLVKKKRKKKEKKRKERRRMKEQN
jgi:hypothetical protein